MTFQALKDKNPTSTLKRFMREVAPMQFVREIYVNAVEAGATKMRIYYEDQHLDRGVRKLCFADNGKGMTAQEMYEYLAQYNSSSKTTEGSYHDNFGIGVKATTLLANPYGVVFLSWSAQNPEGAMIWFTYDEAGDRVGLKPIEYIDEDGEHDTICTRMPDGSQANVVSLDDLRLEYPGGYQGIKWWECKETAKIDKQGTIVMLLGADRDADSVGADWSSKAIPHYISSRFLSVGADWSSKAIPHYISSRFLKIETQVSTCWRIGRTKGRGTYRARGLLDVLYRYVKHTDTVEHHGFVIDVIYVDVPYARADPQTADALSSKALSGYSALEYKGELYHVTYGKREARSWGISHDDVIKKVLLIVRPPHRGVQSDGVIRGCYPNERRDRLLWDDESIVTDNREIDLSEIKRYFATHHPERLTQMLEEAYASNEQERVDTTELRSKYMPVFKSKRSTKGAGIVASADGDLSMSNAPGIRINPDWVPLFPPESKPEPARPRRKGKAGQGKTEREVIIEWIDDEAEFVRDGVTLPFIVTLTDKTAIKAFKSFSMFVQLRDHLMSMYESSSEVQLKAEVQHQIERHYTTDLDLFEVHRVAQGKLPLVKAYDNNEAIDQVLAFRVLGSAWLMQPKIEQALAQAGYKKRKA
jgi:hypothetical protein